MPPAERAWWEARGGPDDDLGPLRNSLLGKLGAASRTKAVTLATRRGLLTVQSCDEGAVFRPPRPLVRVRWPSVPTHRRAR